MTRGWPALRNAVFDAYAADDYDVALGLANEAAARFPEHETETAYWRACLHARLGRPTDALDALRTAFDHGGWWSPAMLETDDDLAPLQSEAEFLTLITECRIRMDEANAASRPEVLMLEPQEETTVLLLALHGRMSSAADQAEHWRGATSVAIVALPQSSRLAAPGAYCWDDVDLAHHELVAAYERLAAERRVEQVVLGGFSQGAAAAIVEALADDEIPAIGFIAVAPSFGRFGNPTAEELRPELGRAAGRLRGHVVTGENDIRLEETRTFAAQAKEAGLEVELEVEPGLGHDFPPDFSERVPGLVERIVKPS